jgi:hypothetical protein
MGTKEYHAQKSREWYERTKLNAPDKIQKRHQYAAERRRANKSLWVHRFGNVCHFCKETYPDCVFEFHHLDHTEKDLQPSHMFHLKKETIEKEIVKCIMLCANCHRIEHDRLKYDAHSKRLVISERNTHDK